MKNDPVIVLALRRSYEEELSWRIPKEREMKSMSASLKAGIDEDQPPPYQTTAEDDFLI